MLWVGKPKKWGLNAEAQRQALITTLLSFLFGFLFLADAKYKKLNMLCFPCDLSSETYASQKMAKELVTL